MLKGIHCNFLDVLRALHIQQIGTGITSADRYFHCDFFAFCEEDSIKMLDHAATRMYAREKLLVWEKAHPLTLAIDRVTTAFPAEENYGLTSQMRRAAASIPSNIAEGCGRQGDAELARFCTSARGSASELEYQILLSRDLQLIQTQDYERLTPQAVEIKRMLTNGPRRRYVLSRSVAYSRRRTPRSIPGCRGC